MGGLLDRGTNASSVAPNPIRTLFQHFTCFSICGWWNSVLVVCWTIVEERRHVCDHLLCTVAGGRGPQKE